MKQFGNCVSSGFYVTRNHEILYFLEFSTNILLIFSANSCKLVLLLPFLVITKVAKLSIFKCIEVFCNEGAKILRHIQSLIIISKLMTLSVLSLLCFYDRYASLTHSQKLVLLQNYQHLKKLLFWVNHRLLMVFI